MDSFELWELRVLYEPRTLRTLLISPYSFKHSKHSNSSVHVKHFEQLGLSCKLKEIDFNALECVGGLTLRRNRTARIAQVVIRVKHSEYLEWIEWVE